MKTQKGQTRTARRRRPSAAGSVCCEPTLPANWGKVKVPPGMVLRPLTEKDMQGYSEEEWQDIVESEKGRTQNESSSATGPEQPRQ